MTKATACPACESQSAVLVRRYGCEEAARHYVSERHAPERYKALVAHLPKLWGADSCAVMRCGDCGLCFSDPFVAGDHRFYDLAYERGSYPSDKWEYDRTLEALRDRKPTGKLLEVGAGDGAFLRKASALLPSSCMFATEWSAFGLDRMRSGGFECEDVDVRELGPEHDGQYGAICMFQVLEHMDRLDDVFDALGRLATPDARLFVAVPNGARIDFNEAHGALLDMPPNHVSRWTRDALARLGSRHGWGLVDHALQPGSLRETLNFAQYRVLRGAQKPGSLAGVLCDHPNRWIRRAAKGAGMAVNVVLSAPYVAALAGSKLGDSQWAHFARQQPV